ncbi:MAG: hypothetical protein A3H67_03345 [Candidatus Buchananbacteria bacterium RIFCSPLOWO2_02_FULL_46_11b]|uniref:Uncharacterized protein n=1 Tax=Candidatus Buchananbacteria bacterium RIFCSPLOWO2_02_FULL_46_11b TaxID=1797548 RepID=A0A1G1YZK3_9BACT|nr:MAG: hypothetical protein A3H67_03345 [Candidatus Buchananbacteria bacterium RIFCSPLOWO2_02_FULL_46_11b]
MVFLFFTYFNVYHLIKYGLPTIINFLIVVFFLSVSGAILFISWEYTSQINWQQIISIAPFDYQTTLQRPF